MNKQSIKIDIVSDVNCPWCYVGEQRLKKAIAATKGKYTFDINFKPYELNATIPQEGQNRTDYFTKNYGPQFLPQMAAMNQRLTEAGREDGIDFNFDKLDSVNNTFNAHRLIWLAGKYGVQQQVAGALFYSYFTEGKNMNDTKLLAEIGAANGIAPARLEGFFSSEEGKVEVRELEQWAQSAGISGVPAFIINDKYLVKGAQPAEAFLEVFAQVAPALQEISPKGESCGTDGNC